MDIFEQLQRNHEIQVRNRNKVVKSGIKERNVHFHSLQLVGRFLVFGGKHSLDRLPVQLTKTNMKRLGDRKAKIDVDYSVVGSGKKRYLRYTVRINYNFGEYNPVNREVYSLAKRIAKLMNPHFLRIELRAKTKFDSDYWVTSKGRILKETARR